MILGKLILSSCFFQSLPNFLLLNVEEIVVVNVVFRLVIF